MAQCGAVLPSGTESRISLRFIRATKPTYICNNYGANSTWRQAAGRSAILSPGLGFDGVGDGLG
jgi:hypothetical protein